MLIAILQNAIIATSKGSYMCVAMYIANEILLCMTNIIMTNVYIMTIHSYIL